MEGTFENRLNIQLYCEAIARISGRLYGAKITAVARQKEEKNCGIEMPERPGPVHP